jgi:hypothetical protein
MRRAEGASNDERDVRTSPLSELSVRCRVCGSLENIQTCGRCRIVFYCCEAHQRVDWATHKHVCRDAGENAQVGLSLPVELAKSDVANVSIALLLSQGMVSVQVPINDGVVFTVDDLVKRLFRGLGGSVDVSGRRWSLFRSCQERPLHPDDFLVMLGLENFERFALRFDDDPFILRLKSSSIPELISDGGKVAEVKKKKRENLEMQSQVFNVFFSSFPGFLRIQC